MPIPKHVLKAQIESEIFEQLKGETRYDAVDSFDGYLELVQDITYSILHIISQWVDYDENV